MRRPTQRGLVALGFTVPLASIVAECLLFHHDDPARVSGLGLISVTPRLVFVLALLLSMSFALLLRAPVLHHWALMANVAALALLLPGLPGFLEQFPRFSTAWLHVGFVQAIIVHKHPLLGLDARFSWPGFFTAIASLVGMANLGTAIPLLRWAPLAFNLAYVLPIFIIARSLLGSPRQAWIVIWLFILTNWVGQDYFSPQALAYFMFLACLAVVLVGMHQARRPIGDVLLRGLITRFGNYRRMNKLNPTHAQQVGMLAIAMLAVMALSMEHQLTPVTLVVDLIALCLARQASARFFTMATLLALLVWVSYGAYSYWEYHLFSRLFGGGGTQAVSTTVTARIVGSGAHELVVYERILFALGVWLIAVLAILRGAVRRAPVPLTALLLAFVPFLTLAVQSYGGEATLRLYLYTLPFMLIIVVHGLADIFPGRKLATVMAGAIACALIVPFLLIARFGNEQFEQVRAGDVGAIQYFYSTALPDASIWTLVPNGIWGYRGLAKYNYPQVQISDFGKVTAKTLEHAIKRSAQGSYLLITPSQIEYAVVNFGAPQDWGTKLEARLANKPEFRLLYNHDGGRLYEVIPQS